MLKRITSLIMVIMLMATTAISMSACKKKVSEEEAIALVADLVSRSYDLNVVYYGEGLRYDDSGNPNDIYMPVSTFEKYTLRSKLIEDTRAVFTSSYAQSLIDMAFYGVASEINQNAIQSRYMVQGDDEWLYINKNYEPVVEEVSVFDYSTIEITKISKRFIEANITNTKGKVVEVVLVNEDGTWKLDSTTC